MKHGNNDAASLDSATKWKGFGCLLHPFTLISGMSNLGMLKEGMDGLAAGAACLGAGVAAGACLAAFEASSSALGASLGLALVILP
jgi:UDP-N-acetylmuramyl pentapeptide phosphotransferase/UDP-N-acetylglucosamine-1-phosphate transferase